MSNQRSAGINAPAEASVRLSNVVQEGECGQPVTCDRIKTDPTGCVRQPMIDSRLAEQRDNHSRYIGRMIDQTVPARYGLRAVPIKLSP
jgi:hypothetical protein